MPNILTFRGSDFTYSTGNASDPKARCESAAKENVKEFHPIGRVGSVSSDATASLAAVEQSHNGPRVYSAKSSPPPDTSVLVVKVSANCIVVYRPMA